MKRIAKLNRKAIFHVGAFLVVAALVVVLFPHKTAGIQYRYTENKPWGYTTLAAPFDFDLYKTDEQMAEERAQRLSTFYPFFRYIKGTQRHESVVASEIYDWIKANNYSKIMVITGETTGKSVDTANIYTPQSVYRTYHISYAQNLVLDTAFTDQKREEHLSVLTPIETKIPKGTIIVEEGQVVDAYVYRVLQSLTRAYDKMAPGQNQRRLTLAGEAVLVLLFMALFVVYLFVFRKSYMQRTSVVLFFCLQILIVIALTCLAMRFGLSLYIIPFAWVPVLTRVFLDSRTALFLHFTTVLIVSIFVPTPEYFFFIQVAVGMIAVSSLSDMTRRAQLAQTAGWILLVQTIAYTAIVFAQAGSLSALVPTTYFYFVICAILTIGSYGLIYMFEKIFHFISSITLVELTDISSDLLHQLAEKAPGTFQHSMQVSNLASEAAKAIGANALLVRTGALYHDVGKIIAPIYYVENQTGVDNPLIKMDPRDAAQVVIAHVTEGEKLARKAHLPEIIVNFITTHHGTSLVRYFYNTYCNAHPDENVDQKLFRYPGAKPSTKEGAILMMADAIEARSRSLSDFSEASITTAVNQMIDAQIADGQFSETPLSFKDVEVIRRVFVARLAAMNHHRISYPTLNKK